MSCVSLWWSRKHILRVCSVLSGVLAPLLHVWQVEHTSWCLQKGLLGRLHTPPAKYQQLCFEDSSVLMP